MMSRSLMPSAGMGVNSLIPVPSAGIGVNSLMPSAGIGVNSLMLSAGMNSQEKELSGDLFFWPSTNSTGFGNPDPPMMGMSHLENRFKDIGDSSHYGITTPAINRNFQNGENEELLNHNQTNNSRIGMKRHFEELDKSKAKKKGTEEQYNSQQSPMRKNKKFTKEELVEKKAGPQIRLLYRHRIDRQIAQDKETDMKSVLVKPWPMQPDVQGIQQEFHEIANANLEPEEDKERLLEVASKFDILQQQRKEHSTTAGTVIYWITS
ncbi:hypothetical protein E1A91_D11G388600v1 [Gossypium mustelinum]|uniref:Uncharacterized protein n=1 Tax=Gossypium mustelinum TaxID=34275 RepID=A0A5D2T0V5_GOSMU|nr:hypothetical protein E1A91_D11G388600v1 [Gossypium mustelinum]